MIWLQLISILFAIACAKHDAPAVSVFYRLGRTQKENNSFHLWNFFLKVVAVVGFAVYKFWPDDTAMVFAILFSTLWIWLVFDPILNISRTPKRPMDYLGLNDKDGKRWNNLFGKHAGKWKAAILLSLIIALNIVYSKSFS